ncbi:hypothetical protein IJI76_02090 [Candidatus Saccharibacteria bacterium]|nr:hypothetical protein [Candidatus Saccharibacteria bacterium]
MCNIIDIIRSADKTIVLIDDYVDEQALKILSYKKDHVSVKVYSRNSFFANMRNVKRRITFRAGFDYIVTSEFSDRYLLIDGKNLYILSGSLRRTGKRGNFAVRIFGYEEVKRMLYRMENIEKLKVRYMI